MFYDFRELPGQYNLFLDYLYEFENVEKFYASDFRDASSHRARFDEVAAFERPHREALADIIGKQYAGLRASTKTLKNIADLKKDDTLCVVTGQQLGFLGGPLLAFYKTITALKLAAKMNETHEGRRFVPVFWMPGDDHDFDEIRRVAFFGKENEPEEARYEGPPTNADNTGGVGEIRFGEDIDEFVGRLRESFRETDFTDDVFALIRERYRSGKTVKESFRDLLFSLFDRFGLVLFDPRDPDAKALAKPVVIDELRNYRERSRELIQVSAELETVYHAQVKIRPVNLFIEEGGGRYPIEPAGDDGFKIKRKRTRYAADELLALAEDSPERFSPNALLRPVAQDFLFPTAFYVAGPAEISYFAQATRLYRLAGVPAPVVYPRASATILERHVESALKKYGLSTLDVFVKQETLKDEVALGLSEVDVEKEFGAAKGDIEAVMERLRNAVAEIDPTAAGMTDRYKQKIFHYLYEYQGKTQEAQRRVHSTALGKIDRAINHLLPLGSLQEREINFFSYANKYGLSLLDTLYQELSIDAFRHQIVSL
jgi:bacillithiol biosynthesis cysteine-adding enzyme BshC